jgi:hypothetical protein
VPRTPTQSEESEDVLECRSARDVSKVFGMPILSNEMIGAKKQSSLQHAKIQPQEGLLRSCLLVTSSPTYILASSCRLKLSHEAERADQVGFMAYYNEMVC